MQGHFRKIVWLAAASLAALIFTIGSLLAHEGRPVGDYRFVVGWLEEPAYEGGRNAVSVTITKVAEESSTGEGSEESNGRHGSGDNENTGMENGDGNGGHSLLPTGGGKPLASVSGQHHEMTVPVEGLEGWIQAEVTHVASGAKRTMDLIAVFGEPGHYVAHLIPTASGVYEFRVFGTIEGTAINETFASKGGGGGFDDIRSSAGLHFPEELPEIREIESGVRGALQTAQDAQDTALAAQEQSGGNALSIIALIVGIIGVVIGIAGVLFGLRARQA